MLNISLSLKREKKRPFSLFFFTIMVLILSACPYFFLEFREKSLSYRLNLSLNEDFSFSSENELLSSFPFPKVKGLKIYQVKARPDFAEASIYFAAIDQSFCEISFPKTLYLRENQGKYQFCEEPSTLSISLKKGKTQVEVEQKLVDASLSLYRSYELSIEPYQDPKLFSLDFFKLIQEGQFLGKDLVSSFLGKDLYRLKIKDEIFLVRQGNLLFFDKNKWIVSDTIDDISDKPIFKITHIDQNLEIDCFDETGMKWGQKKYTPILSHSKMKSSLKNIEDVSMRSDTKMSMCIEKQKLFLEEKGWAMKKEGKWSMINSKQVSQSKADMLFYVEQVKNGQMIAHWIDPKENCSEKLTVKLSKGSFSKENRRKSKQQRGIQ